MISDWVGSWVTLAEAREAAYGNRRLARRGGDPLAVKRQSSDVSGGGAAHLRSLTPTLAQRESGGQLDAAVGTPCIGTIGRYAGRSYWPGGCVGGADAHLDNETGNGTGRVRRNIRATVKWCQAHGFVAFNAAGEAIDGALPRMPAVKAHFRALPYSEIPEALEVLEEARTLDDGSALVFPSPIRRGRT